MLCSTVFNFKQNYINIMTFFMDSYEEFGDYHCKNDHVLYNLMSSKIQKITYSILRDE